MTDRLVNAETLAAALAAAGFNEPYGGWLATAEAILAAIPPDPRLDALLAAARDALTVFPRPDLAGPRTLATYTDLRDALAAFEEGTTKESPYDYETEGLGGT